MNPNSSKNNFYKKLIQNNKKPLLMGILNITPDSFYDGGTYNTIEKSVKHVKKMIEQGADIIDIGACSSRPGAQTLSLKEEGRRLFPSLLKIRKYFPKIPISIDTYRYQIAHQAIEYGVDLINNINIKHDTKYMLEIIKKSQTPYVLMHIKGTPIDMQKKINYENFQKEVIDFFEKHILKLNKYGIQRLILDPGFGFGKTLNQNYELLNLIPKIKQFGYPVLTGISRKSMISKTIKKNTNETLNGTTVLNTICLLKGSNIIRVHDVKEAKETIKIINLTKTNST